MQLRTPEREERNPGNFLGARSFLLVCPFLLSFLIPREPGRTRGRRSIVMFLTLVSIQNRDYKQSYRRLDLSFICYSLQALPTQEFLSLSFLTVHYQLGLTEAYQFICLLSASRLERRSKALRV